MREGGGGGVGAGGGVGTSGTPPLILPGAGTLVSALALNQHWPMLSVKKRQPFACHSADAQASQHVPMAAPGMLPSPAVCGLMSVSL